MKIVVTGGAGFIGSHLVDALVARGASVVVVDDFSTGKKENIAHHGASVAVAEGTIADFDFLLSTFAGADAIIHHAALPSVPKSFALPLETNAANEVGTLSVFLAAKGAGVERVIFASSSSVYGDSPTLPKIETMPTNPLSPYAVQKLAGELYGKIFASRGLKTIGLRYFNIFGPRQNPDSEYAAVIPKFIRLMKRGERPVIYGDGEHSRDFTYIDNAVAANLLALEATRGFGEVYNIAAGGEISLNQLVEKINRSLGTQLAPVYESPRVGDIQHSFAAIGKAKELLGYEPIVTFDEGLALTIKAVSP